MHRGGSAADERGVATSGVLIVSINEARAPGKRFGDA
jgi:hypothetical protein